MRLRSDESIETSAASGLKTLEESMDIYKMQYTTINKVFRSTGKLLQLVEHESRRHRSAMRTHLPSLEEPPSVKSQWCDLFEKHTNLCLQVAMFLNSLIAKGSYMEPGDGLSSWTVRWSDGLLF